MLLPLAAAPADASATPEDSLRVRVVDARSGAPVAGALVRLGPAARGPRVAFVSDADGFVDVPVPTAASHLEVTAFGYRAAARPLPAGDRPTLVLPLEPLPLVMDEVVVHARRDEPSHGAAFVERIPAAAIAAPGADLAHVLDHATGVDIQRYGGLGAFSSLSIRGATSEQVLIFLDGVPLNQAVGGGVDLGALPVSGLASIDVYRGAVPGRFGGNSLGGVVHLRTKAPGDAAQVRARALAGSYTTRELSASAAGRRRGLRYVVVAAVSGSDNDFRFWDDNGTEYTTQDDGWARRRNSDFQSVRGLAKLAGPAGPIRWQLSHTHDRHVRGVPGIGNFQALRTRLRTNRKISEANLYGPLGEAGRHAVRLRLYRSRERSEYRDPAGEVGTGRQRNRDTTAAWGLRGEVTRLQSARVLSTAFVGLRRERFAPRDLLRPLETDDTSRRLAAAAGVEGEAGWGAGRLVVTGAWQLERIDDDFAAEPAGGLPSRRSHAQTLGSGHLGLSVRLGRGWTARAHAGRYGRPPGFFELFGDRGAVAGNSDLVRETGVNRDAGLVYRTAGAGGDAPRLDRLEIVAYDNRVDDLIRFIQNSQRVSRAHNIGSARLRGLEARSRLSVGPLQLDASYAGQRARNRSPFSFERGKELPNAPRHRLAGRVLAATGGGAVHYEVSRQSRSFLDRANLRPTPARTVHGVGLRLPAIRGLSAAVEVRNLTDNRVADLWGYPLPGRSWFLSVDCDLSPASAP